MNNNDAIKMKTLDVIVKRMRWISCIDVVKLQVVSIKTWML